MDRKQSSAVFLRVVCAALFLTFTFAYLYFYQADVMTATQHLLSGGQTSYDRTIGAVLITLALFVVQLAVVAITKFTRHAHALTFFPSLLALAVLTGIRIFDEPAVLPLGSTTLAMGQVIKSYTFSPWQWLAPLLLAVYVFVVVSVRRWQQFNRMANAAPLSVASWWHNQLAMALMFLFVGLSANHDDVLHHRLRMESLMLQRDYEEALHVGDRSLATDSNLTMLRIHALARSGQLGDRLFCYPLVGGSSVMVPNGHTLRPVFYPCYRLIRYPAHEFRLAACLLDRDLRGFADELMSDSLSSDSAFFDRLPKHYREALVLSSRRGIVPACQNDAMVSDYEDFLQLQRDEKDPRRRDARLRDVYGNTYWYYFHSKK